MSDAGGSGEQPMRAAGVSDTDAQVDMIVTRLREEEARRKSLEALDLLDRAMALEPDKASIHQEAGLILADLGRLKQAEWQYRLALTREPDSLLARVQFGAFLSDQQRHGEAKEHLDRANQMDPDNIQVRYLLGVANVNLEDPDGAIPHLERAAELAGATRDTAIGPFLPYWLGLALRQTGHPQRAIDQFADALVRFSTNPAIAPIVIWWLQAQIGLARMELKQFSQALEAFHLADATDPTMQPLTAVFYAELHFRQGLYGEYWANLNEAAEGLSTGELHELLESDYFVALGDVYRQLGWRTKARDTYLKDWPASDAPLSMDQRPVHPGLGAGLLLTYLDVIDGSETADSTSSSGDGGERASYASALGVYQRTEAALKQHVGSVASPHTRTHVVRLLRLAWLCLIMGNTTEASTHLQKAEAIDLKAPADEFLIQKCKAIIASRRGAQQEATRALERARELDRLDHEARVLLADAYVAEESLDRGEALYREVLREANGNLEARIGLGRLLIERGDSGATDLYEEAIGHLGDAQRLAESTLNDPPSRRRGSVLLTNRQLAAVSYGLAYARVKAVECGEAKGRSRREFLRAALTDLERTLRYDPTHFQALAAKRRLKEDASIRKQLDWIPTVLLLVVCIPAVLLVQTSFFFDWPRSIDPEWYVATTFALLTFAAIAFYLRELLKVKVGSLEVEKSAVEQGPTITTFAMPKVLYPSRVGFMVGLDFDEVRPQGPRSGPQPQSGARDAKKGSEGPADNENQVNQKEP
jgi:tetratricopeptide (TPR) repeat protein